MNVRDVSLVSPTCADFIWDKLLFALPTGDMEGVAKGFLLGLYSFFFFSITEGILVGSASSKS